MRLPSGLKATSSPPPLRERSSWPVSAAHTFSSAPPLIRLLPSGLQATSSPAPMYHARLCHLSASHTHIPLSVPDASLVPPLVTALMGTSFSPLPASPTFSVLS